MKILIERADLLAALSHVVGVVHRNSNIPILNNVLLSAENDTLTVRATDLDMQAVTSCPAEIQTKGVLTVDAQRLKEIASSAAPGSQLSFEMGDGDDPRLMIKSGRSRFRLPVLSPDQFPAIPDDDWDTTYEIEADVFSDMLARASVSVSQDVSRPMLSGVYLHIDGKNLVAVATSGFRLTRITTTAPKGSAKSPPVILPSKTLGQIIRMLDGHPMATVSVSKGKVRVSIPNASIVSKVIDYEYVDYRRVIPADLPNIARIGKTEFASAVRRAQIAGDVDKHGSGVKLTLVDGVMTVSGRNPEADAVDEIEVEYSGPEMVIGATSQPLLDALNGLGGDIVSLNMLDGKTPVTLTSETDEDALQMLVQRRIA